MQVLRLKKALDNFQFQISNVKLQIGIYPYEKFVITKKITLKNVFILDLHANPETDEKCCMEIESPE